MAIDLGTGTRAVANTSPDVTPDAAPIAPSRQTGDSGDIDALAAGAVRGEPGAFAGLYDHFADRVYRFACFRLGDPDAAADLTHDVFIRALRSIRELREPERFGVWLMRIAHHHVLNHWRSRSRRPITEPIGRASRQAHDDEDDGRLDRTTALSEDPRDAWDRQLDADALLAGVAAIGEAQRQVLALRFVADLSLVETAQVMDRSEDAVKKLQRRALLAVRRAAVDSGVAP